MKSLKILFSVFLIMTVFGCASKEASNLEDARFALDKGNWSEAISKASTALSENANNIEAARILASAYFGRSGLEFLDLAEGIIDLENDGAESDLRRIAGVLPATADMADVRLAIETLAALTGIDAASISNEELADAAFDLGIMLTIEHFALGVYGADYFGTFDPAGITDAQTANVQSDLVSFDNRLIASGVSSDETFLSDIRKAICILSPLSAGDGFTTAEYQAWVGCELSENRDTYDSAAISANIADCSVIHPDQQSAAVQACYDEDTSL